MRSLGAQKVPRQRMNLNEKKCCVALRLKLTISRQWGSMLWQSMRQNKYYARLYGRDTNRSFFKNIFFLLGHKRKQLNTRATAPHTNNTNNQLGIYINYFLYYRTLRLVIIFKKHNISSNKNILLILIYDFCDCMYNVRIWAIKMIIKCIKPKLTITFILSPCFFFIFWARQFISSTHTCEKKIYFKISISGI